MRRSSCFCAGGLRKFWLSALRMISIAVNHCHWQMLGVGGMTGEERLNQISSFAYWLVGRSVWLRYGKRQIYCCSSVGTGTWWDDMDFVAVVVCFWKSTSDRPGEICCNRRLFVPGKVWQMDRTCMSVLHESEQRGLTPHFQFRNTRAHRRISTQIVHSG